MQVTHKDACEQPKQKDEIWGGELDHLTAVNSLGRKSTIITINIKNGSVPSVKVSQ